MTIIIARVVKLIRKNLTRNIMTAYFFAYTTIDRETGRFLPIEDFETYTPILYTGNIAQIYAKFPDAIKNMSLQLLTRPKIQDTLSLNLESNIDIKSLFNKIELPKNINVSRN